MSDHCAFYGNRRHHLVELRIHGLNKKTLPSKQWSVADGETVVINQILKDVIERIEKELPNFRHILEHRPYKSVLHQKAVEIYSFELLESQITRLKAIGKFRREATAILEAIKSKDVSSLMPRLTRLKERLSGNIAQTSEGTEEIFSLRPNFYGIGINFNELWKKFRNIMHP